MKFLYAAELKELFAVYGSYYDLRLPEGETVKCRNFLEIFRRSYRMNLPDPPELDSSPPDAMFVMMNPGSSEPRQFGFREPVIPLKDAVGRLPSLEMVFAKPDVTQYQVMRIMAEKGWNHVRVVNLSDIREPKSILFFKRVKEFGEKYSGIHTLFSPERKDERLQAFRLKQSDSPVILGWGRDKKLLPLAEQALGFLKEFNTAGLVSPDHPMLYSHPSPNIQTAKIAWLKKILLRIQ